MSRQAVEFDVASLWVKVDEATGGALYALRYECQGNGWTPHLWAQTSDEGAPSKSSRLFFIGSDALGRTVYFDTALIEGQKLAGMVRISASVEDAQRTAKRLTEGLRRLDQGLEPDSPSEEIRKLN